MKTNLLIVVVNYNDEVGLSRTLDSINAQNIKIGYQVTCFDGGSQDSSVEIALSFKNFFPICAFSEKDNGIYDAMNKGLMFFRFSEATHIMFLNSGDSFSSSNSLSVVLESLFDDNIIKFFRTKNYYSDLSNLRPVQDVGMKFTNEFNIDFFPCHQAIVFPKNTVGELLFDESYKISADTVFIESLFICNRSEYIPHVVVDFELGGISSFYGSFKHFLTHYAERLRSRPNFRRFYKVKLFCKLFIKYFLCRLLGKYYFFKLYLSKSTE